MGLEILDVLIGLVVVYLILSLVVTTVIEAVSQSRFVRKRARVLHEGLERLMGSYANRLLRHPEIRTLSGGANSDGGVERAGKLDVARIPSYIPTTTFAAACLDVIHEAPTEHPRQRTTLECLTDIEKAAREGSREQSFARAIRNLWQRSDGRRDQLLALIGQWFDDGMERVSGSYRRWAQFWSFVAAAVLVVVLDADTVRITGVLYQSPETRQMLVQQAVEMAAEPAPAGSSQQPADPDPKAAVANLKTLRPILGSPLTTRAGQSMGFAAIGTMLLGWLVSALAASMGAPFWFKVLNRMLRARARIKGEEAPKDETPATAAAETDAASGEITPREVLPLTPLAFGSTFSAGARDHSDANAYWLGKFAELAYQDEAGFSAAVATCAPTTCRMLTAKDTQVHIASWPDYVVVAFRGTETVPGDIATDARFELTTWAGTGKVHSGFHAALVDVWPGLEAELQNVGAGPSKPVWFTGHSLGGALAVLAASEWKRLDRGPVAGLYTIGQPRVGDEAFTADLADKMAGRYFRYVNHRDAVPRVPVRAMGYYHTGKLLYFEGNGALDRASVTWTRWLDVAFGGNLEAKVAVKEAAGDHSATEYVERLRRLLA